VVGAVPCRERTAMSWSSRLAGRLRTAMTSYRFGSDYRVELARIESIHHACREHLGVAEDRHRYLWRSICQYRCQSHARGKLTGFAANLLAVLALPWMVLLLRPARRAGAARVACGYLKIDFHPAYQIPQDIRDRSVESARLPHRLNLGDLRFACKLFVEGRAFYPELLLKFLLWIAAVRPHLERFEPQYLIQYCEYSAHSSLRKLFLNAQGIGLANVTHGEEFISCRSAFASFDQYFAWQLTPRSIHDAMHIEYQQRFSFNPCAGLPTAPPRTGAVGFLWPALDASQLELVVVQINELSARCEVIVRPHPNPKYANHFEDYRHRLRARVSDAHQEGIHSFIDRSALVVGYLSAVLLQAVFRGRKVVYLRDPYLASLQSYHSYYADVKTVELAELARYLAAEFFGDEAK
jgi:hypothetical protein